MKIAYIPRNDDPGVPQDGPGSPKSKENGGEVDLVVKSLVELADIIKKAKSK